MMIGLAGGGNGQFYRFCELVLVFRMVCLSRIGSYTYEI